MKIYISEKYLDLELLSKSEAIVVGSDFDILSPMGADGGEYVLAEVQEDTEVKTIEQHNKELLQEFCISLLKDIHYSNYEEKLFVEDYLEPRIKNLLKERGVK